MTIHEQVRAAYLDSGLSQEEIAHRAGVSSKTLWNILSGRATTTGNLFAVAQVLGISTLDVPPPPDTHL